MADSIGRDELKYMKKTGYIKPERGNQTLSWLNHARRQLSTIASHGQKKRLLAIKRSHPKEEPFESSVVMKSENRQYMSTRILLPKRVRNQISIHDQPYFAVFNA